MSDPVAGAAGRPRVLVLDGEYVPALSVVRSLGRRGLGVEVASSTQRPLAGYSRYAQRVHSYPDPLDDADAFLGWVAEVATSDRYGLIVPVTEKTLAPLTRDAGVVRRSATCIALPPREALEIALSKGATVEAAAGVGVPVPRSVSAATIEDVEREAARIGYPIVIKPDRSVGGGQAHRRVQLAVTYAKNAGELRARAEGLLRFGKVVLQERFVGQGVGVELIANRGEIAYAFQHIRLHELPLSGGGSSLRRSAPLDPALLEASTRLVRVLKWHGVAMVEFKQNADTGEFRLMEINGRLWGSLPLAVACGADFPSMMYDLYIQGRIDAPPPARVGISCRKLSDDIYWHELVLRRIDPTGLARFPPARVILRDALLCLSPRHRFDVQQLSDPRPGFVDVARIAKRYAVRLSEQWRERVLRSEQERRWRNGTAAAAMKTAGTVLFLCHGNINRSVLAQRYLEQRLGRKGIEVLSAGFHETEERSADPVMQDVAGRQGIDLSGWRSRTLSREMLSRADMVLVMESSHLKRIRTEFPDLLGKCYMLGFAAPGRIPGGEIADPYGKDILEYERCFRQVTASVEAFAARLHGVHPG